MTVYGSKDLTWKDDKLYFKDTLMYTVVQDDVYKHMYYMKSAKGRKSKDYYNIGRACDNCVILALKKLNKNNTTEETQ